MMHLLNRTHKEQPLVLLTNHSKESETAWPTDLGPVWASLGPVDTIDFAISSHCYTDITSYTFFFKRALFHSHYPQFKCPWARHITPNHSLGTAAKWLPNSLGLFMVCVCVCVCAILTGWLGWVKFRARIPSMGQHTWLHLMSHFYALFWTLLL